MRELALYYLEVTFGHLTRLQKKAESGPKLAQKRKVHVVASMQTSLAVSHSFVIYSSNNK